MTDDERAAPDSLRGKLQRLGRPEDEAGADDEDRAARDTDRDAPAPPDPKLPTDPPF